MQVNEFFAKYANTPMDQRLVALDFIQHGMLTLEEVNRRIHVLEDAMRPMRIEQERLIRTAEQHWRRRSNPQQAL